MDSVSYHSKMSEFYKYRTPYVDLLFENIFHYLKLNNKSIIVDLCCGSGELSSGLSKYVKKIHAVDGSRDMLSKAPSLFNVHYYHYEVCKSLIDFQEPVDHVFIGKAVHWLNKDCLYNSIKSNLKNDGSIVIIYNVLDNAQWSLKIDCLLNEYGRRSYGHDFTGKNTLNAIGYAEHDKIIIKGNIKFDLEHFMGQLLSLSYGEAFENILKNYQIFKEKVTEILSPFMIDGFVNREFYNIALIYRK